MTPQEEQLLNSLVERINQTKLQEKDTNAEALLTQGLSANPDAVYILAQTVLVQSVALDQAKAQLTQLQQQVTQLQGQLQQARQQPAHATSFLGNLLGRHDTPPPPPIQTQPAYLPPQQGQGYAPPPPPPPGFDPQYAQPGYGPGSGQPQYAPAGYAPTGQPSFMRGAMQTAAGVAAGALAFEGVEAVLHGIGGMGHPGMGYGGGFGGMGMGSGLMGGGGMMGAGFERPIEETVVNNNYYDQPGSQSGGEQHFHQSADEAQRDNFGNQFATNGDQFTSNQFSSGSSGAQFVEQSDRGGAQFSDANYTTPAQATQYDANDYADTQDQVVDDQDNQISEEDSGSLYDDGGSSGGSYDDNSGGGDDNSGSF